MGTLKDKDKNRRVIYLSGHSRGGTTWLGELLALHPQVRYIFEPFASQAHPYTGVDTQTLFNNGRLIQIQKHGRPVADYPSLRFFNMDPEIPTLRRYKPLVRHHVDALAASYFPEAEDYYLLLKQPRLENVGWAMQAIGADHLIIIDRHPFGVINSYHRGGFWSWLRLEWPLAKETVPSIYPAFTHLFEGTHHRAEKLLVLSYMRSYVAREYCVQNSGLLVEYEHLCMEPVKQLKIAYDALELPRDRQLEADLRLRLQDTDSEEGHYHETKKVAEERAWAWRRELPSSLLNRLCAFVQEKQMEVALPGRELPAITKAEKSFSNKLQRDKATKELRRAVKQYLRQVLPFRRSQPSQEPLAVEKHPFHRDDDLDSVYAE